MHIFITREAHAHVYHHSNCVHAALCSSELQHFRLNNITMFYVQSAVLCLFGRQTFVTIRLMLYLSLQELSESL